MPFTDNVDKHAEQRGKFFMVLALASLTSDLDSIPNQILSSANVLSYDTVCEQLLRLPASSTTPTPVSLTEKSDSTTLISNSYQQCGRGGGRGNNRTRPRCSYCNHFGHVKAQCQTKANQVLPKVANVTQTEAFDTSAQISLSTTEYNEYLQLKAQKKTSTPVVSAVQTEYWDDNWSRA
ncbi:unnamed protein product [Vicia faba]|uniref:CCHC-type domain-containing protein n=1 Tax=Vicia faba TaxID=3906 RepID=A0AAV1ANM9_VICFA|nr:unnamed protein product [Vicia faba]